jgi:hypothetical protein
MGAGTDLVCPIDLYIHVGFHILGATEDRNFPAHSRSEVSCVAADPSRDVVGGRQLLGPKTGCQIEYKL